MEELNQEVESENRIAQNKRQERIDEEQVLQSLQDEFDVLRSESIALSAILLWLRKKFQRSQSNCSRFESATKKLRATLILKRVSRSHAFKRKDQPAC